MGLHYKCRMEKRVFNADTLFFMTIIEEDTNLYELPRSRHYNHFYEKEHIAIMLNVPELHLIDLFSEYGGIIYDRIYFQSKTKAKKCFREKLMPYLIARALTGKSAYEDITIKTAPYLKKYFK